MTLQTDLGRKTIHQTKTYVDFDLNFGKYSSKDLKLKEGENAIKQSIQNLLLTNQFEKPFQPTVYSGIYSYLFDNFDSNTVDNLKTAIQNTINNYDPRINIDNLEVVADEDSGRIFINFSFGISNSEITKNVEFFIERLR